MIEPPKFRDVASQSTLLVLLMVLAVLQQMGWVGWTFLMLEVVKHCKLSNSVDVVNAVDKFCHFALQSNKTSHFVMISHDEE